jgi:hypothetical protein
VKRKDVATIYSHDHLGRWFEGSTCIGGSSVSAKDNREQLFSENGDMVSMIKNK